MTDKMPVQWYKDNLSNSTDYERREKESLCRVIKSSITMLNEVAYSNAFNRYQVKCAEKEGKTHFTDKYKRKEFDRLPRTSVDKYRIDLSNSGLEG